MLKVKSIKTNVIVSGLYMGLAATFVTLMKNGKKTDDNEIIDSVKTLGHKFVVFNGSITENPDIKPLVVGLVSIGYTILIQTECDDDVEPLRNVRNTNFLIKVTPPTDKQNVVNARMLPFLKISDELIFAIDSQEKYEASLMFLRGKLITKPTVTFLVIEDSKLKEQIISDSKNFTFSTRILPVNEMD